MTTISPSSPNQPPPGKGIRQATRCEAYLVSAFELLDREHPGSIETPPAAMHRRIIDGVEADVVIRPVGGERYLIFCDGARYHGADPAINGGVAKIASDTQRRRPLLRPGTRLIHVREAPLEGLPVGDNVLVKDLSRNFTAVLRGVAGKIWGDASIEYRWLTDPDFFVRVRTRSAQHWFPLLSQSVPEERRLKQLLPQSELTDLIGRCLHPEAGRMLPELGRSSKSEWRWRCPTCALAYEAKASAVLGKTRSKGCPSCGGSKKVVWQRSIAANPQLAHDFMEVVDEPDLRPEMVSTSANRKIRWRCRNPECVHLCVDLPSNRAKGSGYCMRCGRANRRFNQSWVDRDVLQRVREVTSALLASRPSLRWGEVLRNLAPADGAYLEGRMPSGDKLSKWGFKLLCRIRRERRTYNPAPLAKPAVPVTSEK